MEPATTGPVTLAVDWEVFVFVVAAAQRRGDKLWRMGKLRSLANQVLLVQVVLVTLAVVVGAAISFAIISWRAVSEFEQRSLSIGQAVAEMPDVFEAFGQPDPAATIQPIAEAIRKSTGASFVVVANKDGIRYSHPNPQLIGQRVSTDPSQALSGENYVGVQTGTLGTSVRAKVPIRDGSGKVIGLVSVGFLEDAVNASIAQSTPILLLSTLLALTFGTIGSLLMARRVRRQTSGLGPREIGLLLEQREAVLHSIREGVVVTDADNRITLMNDEAVWLLGLDAPHLGKRLAEVMPASAVLDVLSGERPGKDEFVVAGDRVLVVNRATTVVRGEQVAAVSTLRDRTELERVIRELDTERSMAHALRTQAHEFFNKLHAVSGLIELGRVDDAVGLIASATHVHQELVDRVRERISEPTLAALLLAKASVAVERGVEFRLAGDAELAPGAADERDLVTVVGNLVDNAVDAAAGTPGAWVELGVGATEVGVEIRVRDSGPGISDEHLADIWREGYTTKRDTAHHGLGLALVRQLIARRGGWQCVSTDPYTEFRVLLPFRTATAA